MNEKLKKLREKQVLRRQLLAQQLGARGPNELGSLLKSKSEREGHSKSVESAHGELHRCRDSEQDEKPEDEEGESEKFEEEFPLEESEYKDSSTFLKGTQSANPHNDYCQHFVDTGQRPQNFIRDAGLADRFEEYPKLRELIRLKDELIAKTNTPPMYLHCDLETVDLADLGCQFDVILVEPPLQEYQRSQGVHFKKYWSWDEIMNLDIPQVAASRSFIFIWCGSGEGLNRGRECLKLWGFRRCEDICWVKTNIRKIGHNKHLEPGASFQRTKEHCLMGIKGTVKRNQDGDFIHANINIDLIISDEPEYGSPEKPVEIFHIIEHFCLGRRRLHLFGRDQTVRPGWLSVGPDLTHSNFDRDTYLSYLLPSNGGLTTGCTELIESLRPKSPPPKKPASGPGGSGKQRGGSKYNFRAASASNR